MMNRRDIGRHSGWHGSGIYLSTKPIQPMYQHRLHEKLKEGKRVYKLCNVWTNPLIITEWQHPHDPTEKVTELDAVIRLSKDLYTAIFYPHERERIYNYSILRPEILRSGQKLYDPNVFKDVVEHWDRDTQYFANIPQPINVYLQKLGYDGLRIEPQGTSDNFDEGAIKFCDVPCQLNAEDITDQLLKLKEVE